MSNVLLKSINCVLMREWRMSFRTVSLIDKSNRAPLQTLYSKSLARSLIQDSRGSRECNTLNLSDKKSTSNDGFWGSTLVWKRAGINTLRCLVGCSLGDFSTMWFLQANYPDLGMGTIMTSSISAGLLSSISLETILLRLGRDQLTWKIAVKTAVGMSFVSMLGMEAVQNMVDYYLTRGVVKLDDARFWTAAAASMLAGFLAPLPYNYVRLRKHGKACH